MGKIIQEISSFGAFFPMVWLVILVLGFCIFDTIRTIYLRSKLAPTKNSEKRILVEVLLLYAGFALTVQAIQDFSYGAHTITVQVKDKYIDYGSIKSLPTYYLHTDAYEFEIPEGNYYDIQVKGCYMIRFYGGEHGPGTFVSKITNIVAVDSTACH